MKEYKYPDSPQACEELRIYFRTFKRATSLKRKEITYTNILRDKMLIAKAIKRGITNSLFAEIKNNSPFNDSQWSEFLDINIRTLQRHKGDKNHMYKPLQSERMFELAEVVSKGHLVFDEPDHFKTWLNTPSIALGKEKPINFLGSSYGKDLVLAELNRIDHGVFV